VDCRTGYITTDNSVVSKSGYYFTDLSGCTITLLDDLVKEDHEDYQATFDYLLKKAWLNLKIDVQKKLSDRFHIDKKLISRETSEFQPDYNVNTELAGITISVRLPKYARLQILSIGVNSENAHTSPEAEFYVYKDDADGDLLSTINSALVEGKNTIQVYEDFEEEKLFIAYNPEILSLKQTKTKYYADNVCWDDWSCDFPCVLGDGSIRHINGGGLNIKFLLYCSIDKLICENLPLFGAALLYRLGVDTMKERITTQKINKTTVLTAERAVELMAVFNEDYQAGLESATANIKLREDPICFMCKSTVHSKTNLP